MFRPTIPKTAHLLGYQRNAKYAVHLFSVPSGDEINPILLNYKMNSQDAYLVLKRGKCM